MAPQVWSLVFSAIALLVQTTNSAPVAAGWPGLWGAARNAISTEHLDVSSGEAQVMWRRRVAGGYSEVAVHAGTAYTMELRGGDDFVVAVDARTGRERWSARVGPTYKGHNSSDDGPIATPSIDGHDLFTVGPHGQLIAIDIRTGREKWRQDLVEDFGALAPNWGFAASPLIEGALVIVPTGGPASKGLLAFDRVSGRLVWNAAIARQRAYSSATAATLAGVRQVIASAPDRTFAVSARDGRELWSVGGPGGNIETRNSPIVLPDNRVLLTYWEEAVMLRIEPGQSGLSAVELWRSPRLRSSHGPTVYRDGFLYGFAGPQLICMDAGTAEVVWRERTGPGMLIAVDDRLVVLAQDSAEVQIAPVSPKNFTPSHRVRVLDPGVRTFTGPSFANGLFYVRSLEQIVAFRLR